MLTSMGFPVLSGFSSGDLIPQFQAKNQDKKIVQLSDFKGKPVLIYFYPKDNTPGCTQQACQLRDHYEKFQAQGIVILGVSRQTPESHLAFRKEHRLPFDLLTDENGDLARLLGVSHYTFLGLFSLGITKRQSLLLMPTQGNPEATHFLLRFYPDVSPSEHAREVLNDVSQHLKK